MSVMRALVIVAHGSRREASNEEVRMLSQQVKLRLEGVYPLLETGFLELAKPSIAESIIRCIHKGATDINILPYFLSAGRHVQDDVPLEIQKVQAEYPSVDIKILSYIGGLQKLSDLLCEYAESEAF
jgi:sirohydrochlorin ferrochelatase